MGLVGFPTVGKTTLFNLLTDSAAETSRFGAGGKAEPNIGLARVPDERLHRLSAMFKPKKTTPATIEYVDIVGVRREDAQTEPALGELRNADALVHVVRAFEDEGILHSEGSIDPARDIGTMETALLLADHGVAEKRLQKLEEIIPKTNRNEDREERDLLRKVVDSLESEQPIRALELRDDEARALRGFAFLSAKPILHVINLGEADIAHTEDFVSHFGLQSVQGRPGTALLPLSARIEQEISQLPPEDAAAFQADLGLPDLCRPRVIRASYALVGLVSFFTVGDDECRAWSIPRDTAARPAAAAIHSDIERGFIRAEVVSCDDLLELGGLAAAREKGRLRLEGKEYPVLDGDVINFRFNV